MRKTIPLLLATLLLNSFTGALFAQQNLTPMLPPPATKLEAMEHTVRSVIVKGTTPIGSILTAKGTLNIACKEDEDLGNGVKAYGVGVNFVSLKNIRTTTYIDYDELDGLLKAIDSLNQLDWSVTSMASFDASYDTKAGFRVVAFSSHRAGVIEVAVRDLNGETGMLLAREQLTQFRGLIEQSKTRIEALMKAQ